MVSHHRFGAKGYLSGSGRRGIWQPFLLGNAYLQPQFYIGQEHLSKEARRRANLERAGFCDITGQTNERSMMAALIPAGVVCGNKVPTVMFPGDPSRERLLVWCAIMNSLPFDWMLRRVITTTVNYFLLRSLPLPKLAKDGLPWRRLASAAAELQELDKVGHSDSVIARAAALRADIDAEVAVAYGLNLQDLAIMANDFPLLDRHQRPLPNEERSTITIDIFLCAAAKRLGKKDQPWRSRMVDAINIGARAYLPSEFSALDLTEKSLPSLMNDE
jgi:hypothetical protein